MNDPDIWAAFESTPPPIEPVANRDNSLQGFQRRLLEECGYRLETANQLLDRAYHYLQLIGGPPTRDDFAGLSELLVDVADYREARRG